MSSLFIFLLLFKFLYAISPPTLNSLLIILGHFNFLAFIFISFELLINSISETFDAFLAEDMQEKYIVTPATNTLIAIATPDIEYIK